MSLSWSFPNNFSDCSETLPPSPPPSSHCCRGLSSAVTFRTASATRINIPIQGPTHLPTLISDCRHIKVLHTADPQTRVFQSAHTGLLTCARLTDWLAHRLTDKLTKTQGCDIVVTMILWPHPPPPRPAPSSPPHLQEVGAQRHQIGHAAMLQRTGYRAATAWGQPAGTHCHLAGVVDVWTAATADVIATATTGSGRGACAIGTGAWTYARPAATEATQQMPSQCDRSCGEEGVSPSTAMVSW